MAEQGLIIVNLGHPVEGQVAEIERLAKRPVAAVLSPVTTQLDLQSPTAEQVRDLLDSVGLSSAEWQTAPFVVVLPGLSLSAALVIAEIHGRCGYFPTVVVLRRLSQGGSRFVVSELVDLQAVRDTARERR